VRQCSFVYLSPAIAAAVNSALVAVILSTPKE
jgi:hypothetical protein